MKNKYKLIVCILLLGGLVSCDLTEIPQDNLSPDTYFKNKTQLQLYTNQFYMLLPEASSMYDEISNQTVKGISLSDLIIGSTRTIDASASEAGWSWDMLRRINYYLQNSHRCEDTAAKDKYDGVAYFWRAYLYFQRMKKFGDVPWYDQVINSTDEELLFKARDTREFITEKILEDIDEAIKLLPETTSAYEVTKWTALALKSRICLFEGTFRKYHAGTTFNKESYPYKELLELCAEASSELILSKKYSLYKTGTEPYRNLFAVDESRTQEVILARCYTTDIVKHSANAFAKIPSKGKPGYTKALLNSYLMTDGSRFTDKAGYETMQFNDETQGRDPRLAQTVFTPGYIQQGETIAFAYSLNYTITGYPLIKYVMGTQYDSDGYSVCDMPVLRLAEVYLNYAEAKAELGTLTQNDLDISVNLLRDRVKMPFMDMSDANANPDPFLLTKEFGYVNVTRNTNTGIILEIRRERGIELVNEGLRYYDLLRWKEGKLLEQPFYGPYFPGEGRYDLDGNGKIDVILYVDNRTSAPNVTPLKIGTDIFLSEGTKGYVEAHAGRERFFDEGRDYLFPIPINERVLTGGKLTQNPGWKDGLTFN